MPRLSHALLLLAAMAGAASGAHAAERPNIVILYADDMGYGDIGAYGHPTIRTPHLDRMVREGLKFNHFYAVVSGCRPARAALMTGRYPDRVDSSLLVSTGPCAPIPPHELTLAQGLRSAGYVTGMSGKWHLQPPPAEAGFDHVFTAARDENTTRRKTEAALQFFRDHRDEPFFFYLPYYMPHVPLRASEAFRGASARGFYGDVIEELDWSAGRVMDELQRLGIADRTLVFFTSDHGPWLREGLEGGSPGLLRQGKATTWEGGMRVPAIAWWPGRIEPGRVTLAFASTMDLYMTCLALAGAEPPADLIRDGIDLGSVLLEGEGAGNESMIYYHWNRRPLGDLPPRYPRQQWIGEAVIHAARVGHWKAHFLTQDRQGAPRVTHDPPLLFHLGWDPSETTNLAGDHPEVIEQIRQYVERHVRERDAEKARLGVR